MTEQTEIEQLRAEVARLRAALEAVEAVYDRDGNLYCPWCNGDNASDHKPDCMRQKALGLEI